jgi:hypothetical protein
LKTEQQKLTFFSLFRKAFTLLGAAVSVAALPCHAWVNIEAVPVGHVGNLNDNVTGLGRVDYEYCIGKYEVTLAQYTEFLNAVAKTDTYRLYAGWMTLNANTCGISRQGTYPHRADEADILRPARIGVKTVGSSKCKMQSSKFWWPAAFVGSRRNSTALNFELFFYL